MKAKSTSKSPKARSRTAKGRSLKRVVRQIADRLFTVSYGTKDAEEGTRLAVMKGNMPHETHLGGWCRSAAEMEIEAVLSNAKLRDAGESGVEQH